MQFDFFFFQEVGHLLSSSAFNQSLQEPLVVNVSIGVFLAQLRVSLRVLNGFFLLMGQMLKDELGELVETSKDSVLNDPESNLRDMPDIGSSLNECFHHLMVILLDCDAEGSFSLGRDDIDIGLLAEQQLNKLHVAVISCPHQRSMLGLLDQRVVEQPWVLLDEFLHIGQLILLDVVVEVLLLGVQRLAISH